MKKGLMRKWTFFLAFNQPIILRAAKLSASVSRALETTGYESDEYSKVHFTKS